MEFVVLESLADIVILPAMASLRSDRYACDARDRGGIVVGCEIIKHDKSWNIEQGHTSFFAYTTPVLFDVLR